MQVNAAAAGGSSSSAGGGGGGEESAARGSGAGGGGPPPAALRCPRCDSANTKFCYYNNYSLLQPRYFCKGCRRYWTKGGALRNVPIGGGCRKTKRSSSGSSSGAAQHHHHHHVQLHNINMNPPPSMHMAMPLPLPIPLPNLGGTAGIVPPSPQSTSSGGFGNNLSPAGLHFINHLLPTPPPPFSSVPNFGAPGGIVSPLHTQQLMSNASPSAGPSLNLYGFNLGTSAAKSEFSGSITHQQLLDHIGNTTTNYPPAAAPNISNFPAAGSQFASSSSSNPTYNNIFHLTVDAEDRPAQSSAAGGFVHSNTSPTAGDTLPQIDYFAGAAAAAARPAGASSTDHHHHNPHQQRNSSSSSSNIPSTAGDGFKIGHMHLGGVDDEDEDRSAAAAGEHRAELDHHHMMKTRFSLQAPNFEHLQQAAAAAADAGNGGYDAPAAARQYLQPQAPFQHHDHVQGSSTSPVIHYHNLFQEQQDYMEEQQQATGGTEHHVHHHQQQHHHQLLRAAPGQFQRHAASWMNPPHIEQKLLVDTKSDHGHDQRQGGGSAPAEHHRLQLLNSPPRSSHRGSGAVKVEDGSWVAAQSASSASDPDPTQPGAHVAYWVSSAHGANSAANWSSQQHDNTVTIPGYNHNNNDNDNHHHHHHSSADHHHHHHHRHPPPPPFL